MLLLRAARLPCTESDANACDPEYSPCIGIYEKLEKIPANDLLLQPICIDLPGMLSVELSTP